ncbi:MAG: hypothetical protein V5A38_07005 [Halolamina sp.]|uniref:hypothetical protein n=1 Tax=Halolamina sp. TaxID=1940283 RepID=UPI002FC2925C
MRRSTRDEHVDCAESASDATATTRRRALAGGTAALVTALAGCSSLPLGGEEEPQLGFDPEELPQSVLTALPERPSAYAGPVPDQLTAHHRERAQTLLDDVPTEPSFPNGKMSERLAEEREQAVEGLRDGPDAVPTPLDRLGHWRYIRSTVANVWGAYHAAAGDIDAATLESRREEIRRDLFAFEAEWSYPGVDSVEALAVNYQFERLRTTCRRYLAPRWSFPDDPTASVFRVGRLVNELERARAELDDLTGLHEAFQESTSTAGPGYRTAFSVLAPRLEEITSVSRKQVAPYLDDDADPSDFDRDIERLPAAALFTQLQGLVIRRIDDAETAHHRGDNAQAVIRGGQALVAIVALSTAVAAIRDGRYGMPDSVSAVTQHRETALDELERTESLEPSVLATLLAMPAWDAVAKSSYIVVQITERENEPDQRDVVNLVAAFASATHLARAVPAVLDRVTREIDDFV